MADDDEGTRVDPEIKRLRSENQSLRERLRATEGDLEAAKAATTTAVEAAKAEVRAEAARTITEARLVAAAASKLADPADVAKFVDVSTLGDGSDTAALTKAVEDLIAAKPYLAKSEGTPPAADPGKAPTPPPSADQGQNGTPVPVTTPSFNEVIRGLTRSTSVTFTGNTDKV